ncbi:flavin reductase family protein [Fluviicola sp.]|jgi:flavin reductase (DIM6/NTAB) family NADH-FMN oxidoreductase RutF|uniref:flavin reductase family protein n=1 Tax=Fluviicola sp. TaxID=1917219 RepID=UPI002816BC22|nr:flavin reductase family protein [Fluviicola sp.]MDR0803427.1 flavin reductase family protein [Fluviicola sp.]
MLTLDPKELPIPKLHGYLLGAIGPRPIAFASTIDENGGNNLSPFSFFNVFSAAPPVLIFSPSRNGRTNTTKDTYNNIKKVPEVVINIVNYDILHQMSLSSSPFAPDVDEFVKAGLTPVASDTIKPMRVLEAPVQFECKVLEVKELGDQGGAGNLVICEVTKIHIHEEILAEDGTIDQKKINLVARMGGNWYCHANEASMFEITKPVTTIGIGFDQLPDDIRQSVVLSKNDLAQLAGVTELPDETDVNEYKLLELSDLFLSLEDRPAKLELALHQRAKELIYQHDIEGAWMTLLSFND